MLLSLSEGPELNISEDAMQQAIALCELLVGNVREMTHGKKGLSESKNIKKLIIDEFLARERHQISRKMLLKRMWAHYKGSDELDDIMVSFDEAGVIKIETIGNQIVYTMPDHQVTEYKRLFKGKNK
jgi:hypothetical protein